MNEYLKQAIAAARASKYEQARVLVARVLAEEPENVSALFLASTLAKSPEEQIELLNQVLVLEPGHGAAAKRLARLSPEPAGESETVAEPEVSSPPVEETPEMPVEEPLDVGDDEELVADTIVGETGDLDVAPTVTVSSGKMDFLSQSKSDTVPGWLAEEHEELGDLTVISEPAVEPPEEPEELPEWLQNEPQKDWLEKEQDKGGQVLWRAGGSPDSATPGGEKVSGAALEPYGASPAKRPGSAEAGDSSSLLLGVLVIVAVIVAIVLIYVIISQPL